MEKVYYVYILASNKCGTLYIGVTSDIIKRIFEHKSKFIDGFTKKYNICLLVYYEQFGDIELAIKREKRLKKYRRADKIKLIEKDNPDWKDLYQEIVI